ncbi:MAG: STAS domain-containing protein [Candidatus Methylacidiphilales bacterium]
MTIDFTQEELLTILKIEGDVDLHHSPRLRSSLQAKVKEKCPALLVDFSAVNYIDSSGLATFVEYYQGCRQFDGKIALAAMSARVRSVFELVRLGEVFPILDNLDDAKTKLTSV